MLRPSTYYNPRTHVFPDDLPERLEQFKVGSGLSWAEIARRLGVDPPHRKALVEVWVRPSPRHMTTLLDLAHDLGLGHSFTD